MFPLKKRKLIRSAQGHINAGLGVAADYEAYYVPFVIPFDGRVETFWGPEGGNWLRLIRPNGDKIELAHLSKYAIRSGQVKAGQDGGVTGNTGSITTGPHLHIQIFNNKGVRLDPEKYDWSEPMTPQFPITILAKLVINGSTWKSLEDKLAEIKNWYATNSQGKLNIQFSTSYTNFNDIPFLYEPMSYSAVIDEKWFDAHILDPTTHTTIFIIRDEDLPDNYVDAQGNKLKLLGRTLGFIGRKPTKTFIGVGENDKSLVYPTMNGFIDYVEHELMHTCYMFSGLADPPPYGMGTDWTHKYFYDLKNREGVFSQLDYANIYNLTKGVRMNPNVAIYKNGSEYIVGVKMTSEQGFAQKLVETGCYDLIGSDGKPDFTKIDKITHVL